MEDRASVTDTTATDPNAAINEIADRFFEGVLEREPIFATILGDDRFDDRLPDLGAEGRAEEARVYRALLEEVEPIDPAGLEVEQVITRDMLILVARNQLEAQEKKLYQLAINHISGVQTMPVMVAQYQIAETPEGLEKLLTRFAAYPDGRRPVHRHAARGHRRRPHQRRHPGAQADRADRAAGRHADRTVPGGDAGPRRR